MIKVEQKNWILKQFSSAQVSVTSPRFSALLHSAAATLTATNPRIICCCCETWMIMNYHIQPGWQSLKAPLCREAAESTQVVTQAQSLLRSPHLPCNLFSCTPPSATLVSSSLSWLQEERSEGRGGARRGHRCLKTTSRDFFFLFLLCFCFQKHMLYPSVTAGLGGEAPDMSCDAACLKSCTDFVLLTAVWLLCDKLACVMMGCFMDGWVTSLEKTTDCISPMLPTPCHPTAEGFKFNINI